MQTMTTNEFIIDCVRSDVGFHDVEWWVKALAIPTLKKEDHTKMKHGDLCLQEDGMYGINEFRELVKLTDFKPNKPLIGLMDTITVDPTVMENIPEKVNVKTTKVLVNAILFPPKIRKAMPFLNPEKPMTSRYIESFLPERTVDDGEPLGVDKISVADMINVIDNMNFIESFSPFIVTSGSKKSITPAPGIDKLRDKLLEEMGDSLSDPVKLVELENKIRAYDAEYLKDDPVASNVFGGKSYVARFKLFGIYGRGLDFDTSKSNDTLIKAAVSDGLSPDPEDIRKYFNDLRYASFSRGDNTALAGTIYKTLQRSLTSLTITSVPCNTTKGLIKVMTKNQIDYSVGRYIKNGGKWSVIQSKEQALTLKDKVVEMRSPLFCTSGKDTLCYACMSNHYKNLPNGISNLAANISGILLNMFLKLMHGVETKVVDVDIDDLIC